MSLQLQEFARQIRNTTIRLAEAAEEHWLKWSPPGTSNHILWHAGHALWLADVLCISPLDSSRSDLPPGWAEKFGMDCRPPSETADWPDRKTVVDLLRQQLDVIQELLQTHHQRLDQDWDMTRRLIHGLHDEAIHSGEMHLLMKCCRLQNV